MNTLTALLQNSQNFTAYTCRYGNFTIYCIIEGRDNIIHLTFSKAGHQRAVKLLKDNKQTVQKGKQVDFPFNQALDDYLNGRLFRLPMKAKSLFAAAGTKFQKKVWAGINSIPFGKTITYGELASSIGKPEAVRAVGSACGANPVALIVPCHRVVGKNGLGGFAGGVKIKEKLLDLERRNVG